MPLRSLALAQLRRALGIDRLERAFAERLEHVAILAAEPALERVRRLPADAPLREAELRVSSQFGDDGIIQHLIRHAGITSRTFVEFGVQDYRESNTRFLLQHDGWRGLIVECDPVAVATIRRDPVAWRHDLTVVEALVTAASFDRLLEEHGFAGDLGLLSIDIDGNDYWVWEALGAAQPAIVVVEYNAVLGPRRAVSVPHDPAADRLRAHPSGLLWGCSLPALDHLARRKGYALVGCNSAGNNAYFVRSDRLGGLPARTVSEAFVEAAFRDSRGPDGALTFLRGAARRAAIADARVVDVISGEALRVGDL